MSLKPRVKQDERERIIQLKNEGLKPKQIAERLGRSTACIYKIVKAAEAPVAPE